MVHQFDGYVAQYLGDGVLGYFGYPVAHEDDAQRAVRAGLGLLDALAALLTHPALPPGEPVAVRLGVYTGLVVMGDVVAHGGTPQPLALAQPLEVYRALGASAAQRSLEVTPSRPDTPGRARAGSGPLPACWNARHRRHGTGRSLGGEGGIGKSCLVEGPKSTSLARAIRGWNARDRPTISIPPSIPSPSC